MRRERILETLVRGVALSVFALWAVPAILGGKNLRAQNNAPQSANPAQQQKTAAKPAKPSRRAAARAPVVQIEQRPAPEAIATPATPSIAQAPPASAAPAPAAPAPIWPANQPPNQAKVSWDSRGLEIEAFNSSLDQILQQVAADTGAKLEGLSGDQRSEDQRVGDQSIRDQRIFGTYGPGPARDVLTKLLDGFGYNVLIVGGPNADAPLKVVFLASSPAGPQAALNNQNRSSPEDDDADPPPEAPSSPPLETPFGNGDSGKPENPQQIMQDILNRQHKIDQQQQEQQNNPQQ